MPDQARPRNAAVMGIGVDLSTVDPILILAGAMLAVWAVGTWFDGPGWIHILLTAGIFLWAWRVATRKTGKPGGGSSSGKSAR